MVGLNQGIQKVLTCLSPGTHLLTLYHGDDERLELAAVFLKQGLEKGERCVFFTGHKTGEEALNRLGALIPEMNGHRSAGRLVLCATPLGPNAVTVLNLMAAEAKGEGYAGLRAAAEMTWLLDQVSGPEDFAALCEELDRGLGRGKVTLVSQFREDRFPPELIYNVLKRHSLIVIGQEVFTNSWPAPAREEQEGPWCGAHAWPGGVHTGDLAALLEPLPFPVMALAGRDRVVNRAFRRLLDDPSLAGVDIAEELSALAPGGGESRPYNLGDGRQFSFACVRAVHDPRLWLMVGKERAASARAVATAESSSYHESLLEALPLGYLEMDGAGHVIAANARVASLLSCSRELITGRAYLDLIHPLDRGRVALWLAGNGSEEPVEVRLASGGRECWVRCHGAPSPRPDRRAVIWEDINDRKRSEVLQLLSQELVTLQDRLRFLSTRDALTGLFNRQYFEEEILRLKNPRFAPVSVLIIDVDGLKPVNDSFGHTRGDELLRAAAKVLKKPFRDTDMVARIGGDEFAVVLPQTSYELAKARRDDILRAVQAHNLATKELPLSLSIGVATAEAGGPSLSEAIKRADDDMYRFKVASNGYASRAERDGASIRQASLRGPRPAAGGPPCEVSIPG